MYRVFKKENKDGSFVAFFNPQFPPSYTNTRKFITRSFLEIVYRNRVNYVVEDIKSNYSNIAVGRRVLVEERTNIAVIGIVISNRSEPQNKFTVRIDSNSSDIVVENQNIYQLPYQVDKHGE